MPTGGPTNVLSSGRNKRKYGVSITRLPPLRLAPHAQAQDESTWRDWAAAQDKPLAVDLFAGGGGLSLGLEEAGFAVGLAVDTDRWAVRTHAHNFAGLSLDWDLSDPERRRRLIQLLAGLDVGLVAGGPPCQPFSRAGLSKIRSLVQSGVRTANDERRQLWRAFLEVVVAVRPRAVLLENVPDMALSDDVSVVRQIINTLETAGYACHADVRLAWEHGVPQHRQRLIVVAVRDGLGEFAWPQPSAEVTLDDAINDLPSLKGGIGDDTLPYRLPRREFQRAARLGMTGDMRHVVHDHRTRAVRQDDLEAFRLMDSNTRYGDLPADLRRYSDEHFNDKYKRLDGSGLSRTITAHIAKDGYWYIHPREHRTLTIREAARIQTFPDHYRFAGSRSDAFRQIGNAVPPALARTIGSKILGAVTTSKTRQAKPEVVEARDALADWGRRRAETRPWLYPTHSLWQAVVGSVLSRRQGRLAAEIVDAHPDPSTLTSETSAIRNDVRTLTKAELKSVIRLVHLATVVESRDVDGLTASLTSTEAERVALLADEIGEDRLVTSAPAVRLAGRFVGADLTRNASRRGSLGRMTLARLVGHGDLARLRMAAVLDLAQSVCTSTKPACDDCPVRAWCRSAALPSETVG